MKTFIINNKYKIKANDAVEATRIAEMIDSVKDSKVKDSYYRVTENTGNNIYSAVLVKAENENEAKSKLLSYNKRKGNKIYPIVGATEISDIEAQSLVRRGISIIDNESTKDALVEYSFNWRNTYTGEKGKSIVPAKDLKDAIKRFGDIMALNGAGRANIYVLAIHPNDGYWQAYGKLSDLVVDFKDSTKDADKEELDFLTEEERKAVEQYKEAIQGTTNPKLLELYKHILEDEMEHIKELQEGEVLDSFQPKLGTRFTFSGTNNKEYIVTNTDAGYDNGDHCFEYGEITPDGKIINKNTMRYKTVMADPRLKVL